MKSLIKIFSFAFLCLSLSSCLDEEDPLTDRDTETSPNLIEFYSEDPTESPSAERIYTEVTRTFDIVPEDKFDVVISYSGKNNAPEDIIVDVAVAPEAIQAFNTKVISDAREAAVIGITDPEEAAEAADEAEAAADIYDLMPSELYSFPAQVTIKKGERRATLPVTVKPGLFDFAFRYGLPLTIKSASSGVVSGNFSTNIYSIGAKNPYDGYYSIEEGSTITRNSATGPDPTLSGSTVGNDDIPLVTLSANSLAIEPIWSNGTGVAGIDGTYLTVDPATNLVTVASATNPLLKNTPGAENRYDPATKTFYLAFDWGTAPATRVVKFVLKYSEPR